LLENGDNSSNNGINVASGAEAAQMRLNWSNGSREVIKSTVGLRRNGKSTESGGKN
jgi:hypothetical protein